MNLSAQQMKLLHEIVDDMLRDYVLAERTVYERVITGGDVERLSYEERVERRWLYRTELTPEWKLVYDPKQ